jgi:hypothetical protein
VKGSQVLPFYISVENYRGAEMSLEIIEKDELFNDRHVKDIPVGLFRGKIGAYSGVFLKTYENIVYLANPEITWGLSIRAVHNYVELDGRLEVWSK